MSTGLHARRATGLTVAEREEIFTRTESVARWWREGRAAYERLREALLFDFLFLTGARCSNEARNNYIGGDGDFLFLFQIFQIFVFIFIVFAVLLCRAVLALFVHIKIRKNVCTYVHACGVRVGFLDGAWSSSLMLRYGGYPYFPLLLRSSHSGEWLCTSLNKYVESFLSTSPQRNIYSQGGAGRKTKKVKQFQTAKDIR